MNIDSFIQENTDKKYTRYSINIKDKHNIIILDESFDRFNYTNYNHCLSFLNKDGVLFIHKCLPLVFSLVQKKFPILISKEYPDYSLLMPLKDPSDYSIDSLMISHRDSDYWEYIHWYSKFANKNVICEYRFFKHLFYNRMNPDNVKFL